ncbi:MAG TPA: basic secretory protein-like protein, partial [Polyangiaceae bacterium]|nr:basic secretory protein-like protein [Polyangiaceae bacterium]
TINASAIYTRVSAPPRSAEQNLDTVAGLMAGKKFLETWYPKIANIIAYPAYAPATSITINGASQIIKEGENRGCLTDPNNKNTSAAGWVAGGTTLNICETSAHDMGLYVHESTHIIQKNYLDNPKLSGLPESVASWAGNLSIGRQNTKPSQYMSFYDDYQYGAYFYDFVAESHPRFLEQLNQATFLGQYDDTWLTRNVQRTLGQLWGDMAGTGFTSPGALRNGTGQYIYPKDKGDESDHTTVGLRIRLNPPDNPARFFRGQIVEGKGLLRWEKDYCFGENTGLVVLQTCDETADRWSYQDGAFVNARTNRCMQALAASTADMTPIGTAVCNGSAAQHWEPLPL